MLIAGEVFLTQNRRYASRSEPIYCSARKPDSDPNIHRTTRLAAGKSNRQYYSARIAPIGSVRTARMAGERTPKTVIRMHSLNLDSMRQAMNARH